MNKLGAKNYSWIEYGAKMAGTLNPVEIFDSFVENLLCSEAPEIYNFLEWCHESGRTIGHGNYEDVFADFKAA